METISFRGIIVVGPLQHIPIDSPPASHPKQTIKMHNLLIWLLINSWFMAAWNAYSKHSQWAEGVCMCVQCKCECNANCIISSFQLQLNSSEWYTFCHCFTPTPHSTCAQKTDRQTYTFWPSCFSKARFVFIFRAHLHCSSFVLISFFFSIVSFHLCVAIFLLLLLFFFLPRNGQLRLDDTFELELTILHTQSFAQPSLLSHISVVAAAAAVMRIAVLHTLHCTHNKQQTTHSHRYLAGPLDSR